MSPGKACLCKETLTGASNLRRLPPCAFSEQTEQLTGRNQEAPQGKEAEVSCITGLGSGKKNLFITRLLKKGAGG